MAAAEIAPAAVGPIGRPSGLRRRAALIPLLPIGIAASLLGMGLSDSGDWIRWTLGLAGVAMAFFGFEALGTKFWGHGFEAGLVLASAWLVIVVLAAIFADLLPLAEARNTAAALSEPARKRPDLFSNHPLGTDNQGLDILGGVIYGARVSLQVSLLAVAVGLAVGGVAGVTAGFFRGKVDGVVRFITDSILAFPPLILLLAVVTAITPSVTTVGLALAMLGIPTMARLARANTLTFAQREFVLSARAMGASNSRIIFRELVPNVVRPLLSYAFIIIAVLIVAEASLSFLGVGIQRPTPTWGNMIDAGQERFEEVPHMVLMPGGAMFLTVFSINRVGDKLRQMWDPREATV